MAITASATPAAQLAADSISTIDAQLAAADRFNVDPGAVPGLAQAMTGLQAALSQWPRTIRPVAVQLLQSALSVDEAALAGWSAVDTTDGAALLAYARSLASAVSASAGSVAQLENRLIPFREAIDGANSALQTELSTASQQLAADRQSIVALQHQAQAQEAVIDRYRQDPALMILEGLSIVGLILELKTIVGDEAQARQTERRLALAGQQMAQFMAVRGPLTSLSVAVTGLIGSISNMQAGIEQISGSLTQLTAEQPIPGILAAQLEQIVEDLSSADGIIRQILPQQEQACLPQPE